MRPLHGAGCDFDGAEVIGQFLHEMPPDGWVMGITKGYSRQSENSAQDFL